MLAKSSNGYQWANILFLNAYKIDCMHLFINSHNVIIIDIKNNFD